MNSIVLAIQRQLSYPSVLVVIISAGCPWRSRHHYFPAAQATAVFGCARISTRLDPCGLGAVEIATRKAIPPCSVGLAQAPRQTNTPAMREQQTTFRQTCGPVAVHPNHSGVGPRIYLTFLVSSRKTGKKRHGFEVVTLQEE